MSPTDPRPNIADVETEKPTISFTGNSKVFFAEIPTEDTPKTIIHGIGLVLDMQDAPPEVITSCISKFQRENFKDLLSHSTKPEKLTNIFQAVIARQKRWVYVYSGDTNPETPQRDIFIADITKEIRESQMHSHLRHETSNFLTNIRLKASLSEIMITNLIESGKPITSEHLIKIREAAQSTIATAEDMGRFLKNIFEEEQIETQIGLDELIQRIKVGYSTTDNLDKRRITFQLILKAPQISVEGPERVMMHQILDNLVLNAIRHNPGELLDMIICTGIYPDKHAFFISVTDNGKGISKEDRPHVFKEKYKGKDSTGSGIGLSFVHQTVRGMNGKIFLDSRTLDEVEEKDKGRKHAHGTTFTLVFPLPS